MSSASLALSSPHAGLPPLEQDGRQLSFFEFWPQQIFYAPMVLYWLWLSLKHGGFTLPTIANPGFPFGGWIGESKDAVLSRSGPLAREHIAPWISFERSRVPPDAAARAAIAQMKASNLEFPIVAKPDKGCRGAGVRRVRNANELVQYVAAFPVSERIILQQLADFDAEAGIFYVREPGAARGRIVSLTLKYFPFVRGDGRSSLRELIGNDPRAGKLAHLYLPRHASRLGEIPAAGEIRRIAFAGSHSRGAIFRDGNRYITEQLTDAFDAIAKDIDGFYFGRFDVRFDSLDELRMGRQFRIIEVNGAGAEATHIWDRKTKLADAYRALMEQYRALWTIGAANARAGHKPARLSDFLRAWRREVRLWAQYPPTE